jgi:hypothetical protein
MDSGLAPLRFAPRNDDVSAILTAIASASEAIHGATSGGMDCFVAIAPRKNAISPTSPFHSSPRKSLCVATIATSANALQTLTPIV